MSEKWITGAEVLARYGFNPWLTCPVLVADWRLLDPPPERGMYSIYCTLDSYRKSTPGDRLDVIYSLESVEQFILHDAERRLLAEDAELRLGGSYAQAKP